MNSKVFITNYDAKTMNLKGEVKESQLKLELTFWSREECMSAQASFLKELREFIKHRNMKEEQNESRHRDV
ncbi:hypothetical protein EC917_101293 [Bacillus thuringiensis]|uniref:Uncharacterized protein n=1 Tax=Bacillus thuringiensis TaxID=1428 RepID=A0A4R4BKP9_BACTU|nr:hypothetical protein [Bacillus thuringiensis]TCW59039.1 hypothetical protein EC917_101293 [Bacillus thuringiensis]TCW59721.1 hypothetical protein EC910_101351 [Bacillus thuringiensis]